MNSYLFHAFPARLVLTLKNNCLFSNSNLIQNCTFYFIECLIQSNCKYTFFKQIRMLFLIDSIKKNLFPRLLTLSFWQSSDNIRITWICDGQCADTEIFTACSAQFDVVAAVVMDTGLGQHSVVFDFGFSVGKKRWEANFISIGIRIGRSMLESTTLVRKCTSERVSSEWFIKNTQK